MPTAAGNAPPGALRSPTSPSARSAPAPRPPGPSPLLSQVRRPRGELGHEGPVQLGPALGAGREPDGPGPSAVDEDGGAAHLRPVLLLLGEHPGPGRDRDLVGQLSLVGDGVA